MWSILPLVRAPLAMPIRMPIARGFTLGSFLRYRRAIAEEHVEGTGGPLGRPQPSEDSAHSEGFGVGRPPRAQVGARRHRGDGEGKPWSEEEVTVGGVGPWRDVSA